MAQQAAAPSVGARYSCGNCDNCLNPPQIWDGTEAARMLLSTIYRVQQMSGLSFGAGHLMDILRGKDTEKVKTVWPPKFEHLWHWQNNFQKRNCVVCCAS